MSEIWTVSAEMKYDLIRDDRGSVAHLGWRAH